MHVGPALDALDPSTIASLRIALVGEVHELIPIDDTGRHDGEQNPVVALVVLACSVATYELKLRQPCRKRGKVLRHKGTKTVRWTTGIVHVAFDSCSQRGCSSRCEI